MKGTTPESWALDLASLTMAAEQVWVSSGSSTAHPILGTVTGVQGCFSPPFVLPDLRLHVALEVDGLRIDDHGGGGMGDAGLLYAGGRWMPHAMERQGTYHHLKNGRLCSFSVCSRLVPLCRQAGFLLSVEVRNRAAEAQSFTAVPLLEPGHPRLLPLSDWAFPRPRPGTVPAEPAGEGRWQNGDIAIHLQTGPARLQLPAGGSGTFQFAVMASERGTAAAPVGSWPDLAEETRHTWQARLDRYLAAVPVLTSSNRDLETYYRRSLISGLVCLWDHPRFRLHPHLATSGMDGGGLCTYLWDTGGYAPGLINLMLGPDVHPLARQLARLDLGHCYAMAPDGTPVGVAYAYNVWSFVQLVWTLCRQNGFDGALFEEARRLVLALEERADSRGLIDFGGHAQLLEMRSTGWEHVVASPNAERAWCLRRLADLEDARGGDTAVAAGWRKRADDIAAAVCAHLWDEQAGWFRCLHPDGHVELTYSIQAFDVMRAGVCTPAMTAALLRHLQHSGFLGRYGVSSVARCDALHYELNDPDWSGGGAYIGEAPVLALTLYEAGHPEAAWDVLQRLFWMGCHFPYFPQETYADRPQCPAHKRANVISGLAGAEAILYGLLGLQPKLDGSLHLHPNPVPGETVSIEGYMHRGHRVDVRMTTHDVTVTVDGQVAYQGAPRLVRVLGP